MSSLVLLSAVSCGGEEPVAPPPPPPPPPPVATSVTVSPAMVRLTAVGQTAQLTAQVMDQNGRVMPGAPVAWASSDASTASVDDAGLVTAAANGAASVTATSGAAAGSAAVTVRQQVASVAVSPPRASLAEGDSIRLHAEARDSGGNEVAGTAFLWASTDPSIATVDSTGLVQARVSGAAQISATADGVSGTAEITVTRPRVPPNPAVDEGTSHTLQTTGMRIPHGLIRRGRSGTSHAVVYADLNRDGHSDLFYAPLNRTPNPLSPEVYLNDGADSFMLAPGFLGPDPPATVHARKALPGDFNGDGRIDVFVLGHGYDQPPFPGESNYVLLSSPDGYISGTGLDHIIGFHHGGASADIDADGDLDVFVAESSAGPFFMINDGTGSFRQDRTRIEGIGSARIYTAELVDVDRDGYVDILAGGHEQDGFRTQVLWGDESGVYRADRATLLPEVPGNGVVVDIDVADTDGDGDRDIVLNRTGDRSGAGFYRGYYVQILAQTGPRSFMDLTTDLFENHQEPEAEWFDWLRIYDVDDDGDQDVVVDDVESFGTQARRDLLWENDGSGRFTRVGGIGRPIPPNPRADEGSSHESQFAGLRVDHAELRSGRTGWVNAIAYADFDLDGDIDVFHAPVVRSNAPQPVEFHLNNGNDEFSFHPRLPGEDPLRVSGAQKAVSGDYNGDGRADILVVGTGQSSGDREIYLILSSPTGYRLASGLDDFAGTYSSVASADLDADGDVDVFLPGTGATLTRVGLNNGEGVFTEWPAVERGTGFVLAAEWVDVDRDGYVDLLLGGHEHNGPGTRILWGGSTGTYREDAATVLPAVAGNGVIRDIDAGDLDGDGDRDLVITRTGDGTGALGFYQGYHLQLLEQGGARRFNDLTATALPENRDPEARRSISWVRLHDIDGDGDLDILVDDDTSQDLVWRNDGSGSFARVQGGG